VGYTTTGEQTYATLVKLVSRITLKKVKTFKGMDGVGINAVKAKIAEMAPSQRSSVRRGRQSSTKS